MKQTTLMLSNDFASEIFFEDAKLLGIVAPINDYRFVWYVNSLIGLDFRLKSNLTIQLHKKKMIQKKSKEMDFFFSVFEYKRPSIAMHQFIYHNQNKGESLLPDYKHIDFLWLLKGDHSDINDLDQLKTSLKTIPNVQLVTEISIENLKKRDYLMT